MAQRDTGAPVQPPDGERTKAQLGGAFVGAAMPGLGFVLPGNYATYRQMRCDPTIALARALVMAPIQSAQWSVEAEDGVPDEHVKLISEMFIEHRPLLLEDALRGGIDFGWQGWEKVFELRNWDGKPRQWIRRFKSLLHDITEIRIDKHSGRFIGFKQGDVELPIESCLLYTHDREGDNHHGRPRMENARKVYSWWIEANDGAARYDKKMAGGWVTIHFPEGSSYDKDGTLRPNYEIAQMLGERITAGGTIGVPNTFAKEVDDLNGQRAEKRQWIIERVDAVGSGSTQYLDRLKYLDSLKFRAFLRPERVGLEGTHGTKAESETMSDLSLTEGELLHQDIVRTINWHAVDQVLALNYGDEARGSVWLSAMPLQDAKRAVFKQILTSMLTNPATMLELFSEIDRDAIYDLLDVPKTEQVIDSGDDADSLPPGELDPNDPRAAVVMSIFRELQRQRGDGNGK